MSTPVTLTPGTLTETCYASVQALNNAIVLGISGTVPGSLAYTLGPSTPSVADRDKLWVKTVGGLPTRNYVFYGGKWLWPHEFQPNDGRAVIYTGTLASINLLDGGNANPVSVYDGPFWEVNTSFAAAFPVGVGTFAGGSAVALGGTGGSDEVTLASTEVPDHTHDGKAYMRAITSTAPSDPSSNADSFYHENSGHTTSTANTFAVAGVQTTGMVGTSGEAHDNVPPYVGVYFISRTARQYYVG